MKPQGAVRSSLPVEMSLLPVEKTSRYVLVTPAKNEELNIQRTIESIVSQTIRPSKWIIVDDTSSDHTAAIVRKYSSEYEFITLLEIKTSPERNFSKKVAAFNAGLRLLECAKYSFIGNLDADISLAPDYYDRIIAEFNRDPALGIAGGAVHTTIDGKFVAYDQTLDSVGGAVQLFRRECFDQIGGYIPLEFGGIDAAAEITARMHGWTVRKFPTLKVYEHRRTGTAETGLLSAMYNLGVRFHSLGYGTTFYIFRSIYRLKNRPFLLGSALSLLGFAHAKLKGYPVRLPREAASYLRTEQAAKLRHELFSGVPKVTHFVARLTAEAAAVVRSRFIGSERAKPKYNKETP
ncbi:MAG: glycosyltransferase family 2 protein [Candidatus Acidiferrales bacterium]